MRNIRGPWDQKVLINIPTLSLGKPAKKQKLQMLTFSQNSRKQEGGSLVGNFAKNLLFWWLVTEIPHSLVWPIQCVPSLNQSLPPALPCPALLPYWEVDIKVVPTLWGLFLIGYKRDQIGKEGEDWDNMINVCSISTGTFSLDIGPWTVDNEFFFFFSEKLNLEIFTKNDFLHLGNECLSKGV